MTTTTKALIFVGGGEGYVEVDVPSGGGGGGSQYAFVLDPTATPSGNVYANWPTLYAALSAIQGPVLVEVRNSPHITAGAYALDNITFTTKSPVVSGEVLGTDLFIDVGVTFAPGGTITFAGGIQVEYDDTAPAITASATQTQIFLYSSSLRCPNGGPFLLVVSDSNAYVLVADGSTLGDTVNPVFATGRGFRENLFVEVVGNSTIAPGSVAGNAFVLYDASTSIDPTSITASSQFNDQAKFAIYSPAVPSNWSPAPGQVADALDQLAARPQPVPATFILRPGITSKGNAYATWTALYAALSAPTSQPVPAIIMVDTTFGAAHITAGLYGLSGCVIRPQNPGMTLIIDEGVVIAPGSMEFTGGLIVDVQATTGQIMNPSAGSITALIVLSDGSSMGSSGGAPFLLVSAGGSGQYIIRDNSFIGNGTGLHPVIEGVDTGCVIQAYSGSRIQVGSVLGSVPSVQIDASSESDLVGIPSTLIDSAALVGYAPAVPGNWTTPPTQVKQALDELAAKGGGFSQQISQPVTTGATYTVGAGALVVASLSFTAKSSTAQITAWFSAQARVNGANGVASPVEWLVEYSTDGGTTWLPINSYAKVSGIPQNQLLAANIGNYIDIGASQTLPVTGLTVGATVEARARIVAPNGTGTIVFDGLNAGQLIVLN